MIVFVNTDKFMFVFCKCFEVLLVYKHFELSEGSYKQRANINGNNWHCTHALVCVVKILPVVWHVLGLINSKFLVYMRHNQLIINTNVIYSSIWLTNIRLIADIFLYELISNSYRKCQVKNSTEVSRQLGVNFKLWY